MQDTKNNQTQKLIEILQESSDLLKENGNLRTEDVIRMVAIAAASTEYGMSQLKEASGNLHPQIKDITTDVIVEKQRSSNKPSTQISDTKDSKPQNQPRLEEIGYTT